MNEEHRNCIIYWCDTDSSFQPRRFRASLTSVLNVCGASNSECLWMFPTWEAFESASI